MDEAFLPSGAVDKVALKALSERSDWNGLIQLVGHLAALVVTGALVAWSRGTVLIVPVLVLHGVVLVFLFAPLHETIHKTAFKTSVLNDTVAWICGFLLLLPPEYFRAFHFTHHRYTQDPEHDPELALPQPSDLRTYLLRASGLYYWPERIVTLLRHALLARTKQPFITARSRGPIVREARIMVALYAAIAAASVTAGSWAVVMYWLLPALLGQPALRLYLLAEHTGCPLVPDMLKNSRTTRSNWLVRRLAWNMPYHAEHHAYPALPFHALGAAHELLHDRIDNQAEGYIAVHKEIIATAVG